MVAWPSVNEAVGAACTRSDVAVTSVHADQTGPGSFEPMYRYWSLGATANDAVPVFDIPNLIENGVSSATTAGVFAELLVVAAASVPEL